MSCAANSEKKGKQTLSGTLVPGPRILAAETQLSTCDFSIYEGIELRVKPDLVFLRGRPVLQDGQLLADAGAGRYLRRGVGGLDKEPGAG